MMIGRILFAVPLLLVASLSAQEKTPKPRAEKHFGSHLPPTAIAAMQSIRPDNIETHVRFLSHALLERRAPAQRGAVCALWTETCRREWHLPAKSSDGRHHARSRHALRARSRQRQSIRPQA